jgi:hypothetical protein
MLDRLNRRFLHSAYLSSPVSRKRQRSSSDEGVPIMSRDNACVATTSFHRLLRKLDAGPFGQKLWKTANKRALCKPHQLRRGAAGLPILDFLYNAHFDNRLQVLPTDISTAFPEGEQRAWLCSRSPYWRGGQHISDFLHPWQTPAFSPMQNAMRQNSWPCQS